MALSSRQKSCDGENGERTNHEPLRQPTFRELPSPCQAQKTGAREAPCAAAAHGFSHNPITRPADVALKERTPLVVVPRETPFNTIHLSNQLALSQAGAVVLPAMPGFYHKPKTIDDLVEFIVMKVFDILRLPHEFPHVWKGEE